MSYFLDKSISALTNKVEGYINLFFFKILSEKSCTLYVDNILEILIKLFTKLTLVDKILYKVIQQVIVYYNIISV